MLNRALPTYDHEGKLEALLHSFPIHLVGQIREADVAVKFLGLGRRRGSRMMQTGLLVAVVLGAGDGGPGAFSPVAVLRGIVRDRRRDRGRQSRLRRDDAARVNRRRVRRR